MNNPNAFTEALHALIDLAAAKGNHLTRGEIHFYLKEHLPEEKQFDPVYAFLAEHGIGIEGYEPLNSRETASSQHKAAGESSAGQAPDSIGLSPEEQSHIAQYQEDLKLLPSLSEEELQRLISQMEAGDQQAYQRLVEAHLPLVLSLVSNWQGCGVRIGDLIQEGNIGLMEAVASYPGDCDFQTHLTAGITEALQRAVQEQQQIQNTARHLLDRIQLLDETSRKMAEELDRQPTREELSERLHLSVEEVETIIKHSIDALTVSVEDEEYGKET